MRKLINKAAKAFLRSLSPGRRTALFFQLAEDFNIKSVVVSGQNGDIFGSINDRVVLANYIAHATWAPEILGFIRSRFVSQGGTFVDIGANIGLFTIPVASLPQVSKVIAFEPDPVNYRSLTLNVDLNRVGPKVEAHNLALFDKTTTLSFELSPTNFGDHRLKSGDDSGMANSYGEADRRSITVAADRVDNCISDLASVARPLVIKMDVQGAESGVLGGGPALFEAADVLIVEYWPYGIKRLGGDPRAFLERLVAIYPYMASIEEDGPIQQDMFKPSSQVMAALDSLSNGGGTEHVDLICVKTL